MTYNLKLELRDRRSYGGQSAALFHPICIQVAIEKYSYLEKFCGRSGLGTDLSFTASIGLLNDIWVKALAEGSSEILQPMYSPFGPNLMYKFTFDKFSSLEEVSGNCGLGSELQFTEFLDLG